ncbi:MAG: choice-of-anchor M domain-containing protein [Akkermansiaceae bacterium]
MSSISPSVLLCLSCLPLGAVDLVLGHFEYQIDYRLDEKTPNQGWSTSISYDLDGSFADDEGIVRIDQAGVRLLAAPSTKLIPANPPVGFGQANEPLWILSQNNVPGELFLGWRAVYQQGLFQANVNGNYTPSPLGSISCRLLDVSGTGEERGGEFAMWTSTGFGPLEFHYNSTDGIDSGDFLSPIPAGGHSHYNWGFTKPGTYLVTFQNEGRLNPQNGGAYTSSNATLNFVIPHEGFLRGSGAWRLGDGNNNSPAVAIFDRDDQVDYASNQVVLIANEGQFLMSEAMDPSVGQVGLIDVGQITFPGEEVVTVELIDQTGPGTISLTEENGKICFEFQGDGIYRVTLQARQGQIIGRPFVLTFLSNLEADYSYEAWADSFEQTHQFSSGDLADPRSDLDGDGVSNGLEFLLFWHGFDPAIPDGQLMPKPRFVEGRAEIEFLRDLHKDDFSSTPLELSAAFNSDLQGPWKSWRRLFSEGAADGFYEDGAEIGNETSPIMRRRLVVPDASPNLGFFRFEQRSRN